MINHELLKSRRLLACLPVCSIKDEAENDAEEHPEGRLVLCQSIALIEVDLLATLLLNSDNTLVVRPTETTEPCRKHL